VHARELTAQVERTLTRLPPAQRQALELIRQEGMRAIDAAKLLGTTVGAVKLRVHRACEAIRAALTEVETFLRRGGAR
jgi:RNA polymerase sigma-70 factor (ECF subfamily)